MADLMNGEDVVGGVAAATTAGRFSAYQWAWFYVIGSLIGLTLMGFLVFKGR